MISIVTFKQFRRENDMMALDFVDIFSFFFEYCYEYIVLNTIFEKMLILFPQNDSFQKLKLQSNNYFQEISSKT